MGDPSSCGEPSKFSISWSGSVAIGSVTTTHVPRLDEFTKLMATAIANAEAHAEVHRLADEQAAPSGGMTIGFIGWLLAGLVVAARSMRDMTDVSAAWVARAVEDNEAEFLLALGRAGGGRECDDAEITWVIGGSPIAYHNCVVRADLEPERADATITESQNLMRTSGVAGSWHVGPSMRPTDLGTRLEAHGFEGGPSPAWPRTPGAPGRRGADGRPDLACRDRHRSRRVRAGALARLR